MARSKWTLASDPFSWHPDGKVRRTWAVVMTLCFSRHQYVEFVWDQTVVTWLGCHRRAFEWFACVPRRVIIDSAKCAIVKACAHDPTVQRAYAECAEGCSFKIDPCPPYDPQKKGSSNPESNTSKETSWRCASSAISPTSTSRLAPG
jgi:transposase